MRIAACLGFLLVFCTALPNEAVAAQLAGASDGLQMLKKIQGRWQSDCYRVPTGGDADYRQERLSFSFTHVRVAVGAYRDAGCTHERARHSAKYQFVLGSALQSVDGEKVYALDLHIDNEPPALADLPIGNIIYYAAGELKLGAAATASPGERLTRLDHTKPYRR